ncbi:MAG: hypothetical protein HYT37_04315 [Candidatus Sungbacteria bacterium]|nr:hypothetical protein [Candidatus Sungbacteria bacterium]
MPTIIVSACSKVHVNTASDPNLPILAATTIAWQSRILYLFVWREG